MVKEGNAKRNENRIGYYSKNVRYWQYKGQPVLLLGGSKTDHIFLLDDLKEHLDEIHHAGGNYVRNTMSQREGAEMKPYRLLADGKFDMDLWNDDYWNRFQNMLEWTYERDIIVQIEVWDRFDYSRNFWINSPWNPVNNINYTYGETGLALEYLEHPGADAHPFFHTVKGMKKYRPEYEILRKHQEKFMDKMLSYSLDYGNVLYCMNNETTSSYRWGRYWIRYIKERALEKGVDVFASDMFDRSFRPEECLELRHVMDTPQIYDFIDVSQVNSRNLGEEHWKKLEWILGETALNPRPVNNTKIYGNGYLGFGTGGPKDAVEKFMRDIIIGCAGARFHREGIEKAGIGLNSIAKAAIKAIRKLETLIKLWEVEPRRDLLSGYGYNAAYLAAKPGEKYFVYFTYGDSVRLDLTEYTGVFSVKWIDMNTGEWGDKTSVNGGGFALLTAPDVGGWIAAVTKSG